MIHEMLMAKGLIAPQIDFLLFLQNIRIQTGGVFDNFFLEITTLGELLFPTLFMCLIYWCVDFRAGIYLFTLNSFGLYFAKLFKMVGCVYRPWILDNKVKPIESALQASGGYSFPSGHTAMAAASWGGMAYLVRKNKVLCSILIILVLLIAFSRNYVGVHTPQDVIVSLFIGLICIFAVDKLLNWCEKDKNRYLYVMAIIDLVALITLYYVITKSYPQDFVNGKVLVDPTHAIYIMVVYMGWIVGITNGVLLCAKFLRFDPKQGSIYSRVIRGFIGMVIMLILFKIMYPIFFHGIHDYKITFVSLFTVGFFITAGYPFLFSKLHFLLKKQ
ncbi:phosphatase PAP2 family protein [bacterium]|nr:phosphatase PAP2 family protein [bacterium]